MAISDFEKNRRNSKVNVGMGGSGDPAQTNIIAALAPIWAPWARRRADGRQITLTSNVKNTNLGAHEAHGPWAPLAMGLIGAMGPAGHRAQAGGRRPAAADGGQTAKHFDLQRKRYQLGAPNRRN